MNEFMNSKEYKTATVQINLVLILNSIVLVIKNSIIDGTEFKWVDCLNMSVTIFAILFMTIYRDKKAFREWTTNFVDLKKGLGMTCCGFLGIVIIIFFNFIMKRVTLSSLFKINEFDLGFIHVTSDIFQLPTVWMGDFFSYFFFTMFLIMIYTPCILFCLDRIQNNIKNKNL